MNKRIIDDDLKQKRINEISRKIAILRKELQDLTISDSIRTESQEFEPPQSSFTPGDIVVITNSYKGLKGETGEIISVSAKQVAIKLKNNRIIQRHKSNISKVQDEQLNGRSRKEK
jgi:preprotein translocase subunit YajC